MSYKAIVFNVFIVSPGDVEVERNIVREVIQEQTPLGDVTAKFKPGEPFKWLGDQSERPITKGGKIYKDTL